MLNKLKILTVLFSLLLVIVGCNSLPDGMPPENEIIKILSEKEPMNESQSNEYLATSLMSYLLLNNLTVLKVDCENETLAICEKINGIVNLIITDRDPDFSLKLVVDVENEARILLLYHNKTSQVVWQDMTKIKK